IQVDERRRRDSESGRRRGRGAADLVTEGHRPRLDPLDPGLDADLLVVASGCEVTDVRVGDGEEHALTLELRVGPAQGTQEVRAPDLAPDEVMRMVHDTHLVGFSVPYAQGGDGAARGAHGCSRQMPSARARSREAGVMRYGEWRVRISPRAANASTSRSVTRGRRPRAAGVRAAAAPGTSTRSATSPVRTPAALASSASTCSSGTCASPT